MNDQPAVKKKNLSTTVSVRLSPEESVRWRERADHEGLSLSDYIRAFVNTNILTGIATPAKVKRAKPAFTPVDPDFLFALSKIGNNLNQIARWANTNKSAIEAIQIIAYLNKVENAIIELRENFSFLPPADGAEPPSDKKAIPLTKDQALGEYLASRTKNPDFRAG